jgi:hypothetical protein
MSRFLQGSSLESFEPAVLSLVVLVLALRPLLDYSFEAASAVPAIWLEPPARGSAGA